MNFPFHGPPPFVPGQTPQHPPPGGMPYPGQGPMAGHMMGPGPIQRTGGRFFRFALPAGWQVQENTNMLSLSSPDGRAAIMTVGLVGLMQPFSPDQFVQYAMQMQQLQITGFLRGQPIQPGPGASSAGMFEITYVNVVNGMRGQGIVTCHVALGYGQCNASMTMACARAECWNEFSGWLPQVAAEVAPAGPQTYMAGQVAADNLRNSIELGQHFHAVNDYTQAQWQQVTNERWASDERHNFEFRENLGGIQTYVNPYDNNRMVELSTQYRFYWVNRQGQIVGSDDPGFDPRVGSTDEWSQMPRYRS